MGRKKPSRTEQKASALLKEKRPEPRRDGSPERRSSWLATKRLAAACVFLTFVALALYWPVLAHPFADYDDDNYVTANPHVQSGLNAQSVGWALTATEKSNWHPLTWVSHELDCQLHGLKPAGHHFTNLALHVINVSLLFLVLAWMTGAPGRSVLVALVFAIHPLTVESVAWIAERKNLLCTTFFLLTIGAYAWYARRPSAKRYALVFLLFALGLASKPMVITLPCVLLLLDYWPLGRVLGATPQLTAFSVPQLRWSRLFLEKVPLLLLSAASAAVTIFAQGSGGAIKSLSEMPFAVRIENALWGYAEYFLKVLWPSGLAPLYPHPGNALALWKVLSGAIFLVIFSALVWRRRSLPYPLVGWCWFLGTLVPAIGLVQVGNQAIADRYIYIPIIGLLVLLVWGASDLAKDRIGPAVQIGIAAAILCALASVTHRQIGYWNSGYELWSHTLAVTDNNYEAENNLGVALVNLGRDGEGMIHFQNAQKIAPADPTSLVNIGGVLQSRGDVRQAMADYLRAIQMLSSNPDSVANSKLLVTALANLGTVYSVEGEYAKARETYRQALRINPTALDDLIPKFYEFAAEKPVGERYLWLAEMLEVTGRLKQAKASYEQALQADQKLAEALAALDRLKQLQNRVVEN